VRKLGELGFKVRSFRPAQLFDQLLAVASRHNAMMLLFIMCCGVAAIGAFVIRDLQAANFEAREVYARSVYGLQRIGELQYDAQETRRATLYALTTSDSNLQVEYADQSRDADKRVSDAIAEYGSRANQPEEAALAARLSRDWASYLAVRDEVIASILEGSIKEAVSLDLSGGVPAFERVRQDLNEVKHLYDQDAARRQANLAASSRRSVSRLIGILSFTFLLASAAVWAIQRSHMLSTIQLAKLQMEFVASISHELRTPLAVLMSAADNLADGLVEGKPALHKYGTILQHQTRGIGDLVDQILLFAATEDGKKRYTLEPLEVAPLIDSIVSSTEGLMKEAGAALELQIDSQLPFILGNRTGISQCMQNLIGNAVKYGGADRRIVLKASALSGGSGSDGEVRISVTDHGIGIEPSELPNIFDPFYRSPRVRAAQIHGTGLGLSLAKRIAESMGGGLSVISEHSTGSTFTLHLQIAKGEETIRGTLLPSPTPS
jgi:signal transduction histidine kinase